MQDAAVVPDGDVVRCPFKTALEVDAFDVVEQELQQRSTFLFWQIVNLLGELTVHKQSGFSAVCMFTHDRVMMLWPGLRVALALKFKQVGKGFFAGM